MFIQTEETPNPATLKFLPGQVILKSGSMDFRTVEDAADAPLAKRLFTLQGVRSVFFGGDFVSVTKEDDTAHDATAIAPRQFVVSVSGSVTAPSTNPHDFGTAAGDRIGMMHVNTDNGEIWIYS